MLVLVFAEAASWELTAALDGVAEHFQMMNSDPVEWFFPDQEHWRVLVRFDDKVLKDYKENERELLQAEVGGAPSATLKLLFNQRVMDEACDAAKVMVVHLLEMFHGVVDDCCGEDPIWNIEQICKTKGGVGFLDCYRGQKSL
jgi:hypothetical protein